MTKTGTSRRASNFFQSGGSDRSRAGDEVKNLGNVQKKRVEKN